MGLESMESLDIKTIPAHERPPAYVMDGRSYYRMSSAGNCLRQLVLSRLGYPRAPWPAFLQEAAAEGHLHATSLPYRLEALGFHMDGPPEAPARIDHPAFSLVGHVDRLVIDPAGVRRVSEWKALSKGQFDRFFREGWDGFPHYAVQMSLYMEYFQLPGHYAVKNRDSGKLEQFPLDAPPVEVKPIMQRILQAELAARKQTLPDFGHDKGSFECMVCPFRFSCREKENEAEDESMALTKDALHELQYATTAYLKVKDYDDRITALEAERDVIKEPARRTIADIMQAYNITKLTYGGFSCRVQQGSTYYPAAKVRTVMAGHPLLKLIEEKKKSFLVIRRLDSPD